MQDINTTPIEPKTELGCKVNFHEVRSALQISMCLILGIFLADKGFFRSLVLRHMRSFAVNDNCQSRQESMLSSFKFFLVEFFWYASANLRAILLVSYSILASFREHWPMRMPDLQWIASSSFHTCRKTSD